MYRIKGIYDLSKFAEQNKLVICPNHPIPELREKTTAKSVMQKRASTVLNMLEYGLYLWVEPKKSKWEGMTSTMVNKCWKCYRFIIPGERFFYDGKRKVCHLCVGRMR